MMDAIIALEVMLFGAGMIHLGCKAMQGVETDPLSGLAKPDAASIVGGLLLVAGYVSAACGVVALIWDGVATWL